MRIFNFDGAQLWLEGGGEDARDPIQFLVFNNMVLERKPQAPESIALLMSGQVNQTHWSGGRIDAVGAASGGSPGVNLKICPQLTAYDASISGNTRYRSQKVGHTHVFSGTTFQQAELGVFVDQAESISFDTCHFEGLANAVHFRGGIGRVDRGHFANSTVANPEQGFSIYASEGATVVGHGNMFIGTYGDMARTDDSGAVVKLSGSYGADASTTVGLSHTVDARSEISIGAATTVVLEGSTAVRTINSRHFPGTTVVLRAGDRPITLQAGGNIGLVGDELSVNPGGTITLMRFDVGPEWAVVSTYGAV